MNNKKQYINKMFNLTKKSPYFISNTNTWIKLINIMVVIYYTSQIKYIYNERVYTTANKFINKEKIYLRILFYIIIIFMYSRVVNLN
jgi:hypothetical protein